MSVRVVDPGGMTIIDWADAMVPALEQFGNIGRLDDERNWREWGAELLNLPRISGSIIPDPYAFESWYVWAQRCVENLSVIP